MLAIVSSRALPLALIVLSVPVAALPCFGNY